MGNYQLRKAGLLDIPFLFELIQECSLEGAFSENLMTSSGYLMVLGRLMKDILQTPHLFKQEADRHQILIFTRDRKEVGFLHYSTSLDDQPPSRIIELCAISPEYRNQNIGSLMLREYIDSLDDSTQVQVYCNKYSRAMQHILVKLKFRREKKCLRVERGHQVFYLASFRFIKSEATAKGTGPTYLSQPAPRPHISGRTFQPATASKPSHYS